jgi:hypothetical protein
MLDSLVLLSSLEIQQGPLVNGMLFPFLVLPAF